MPRAPASAFARAFVALSALVLGAGCTELRYLTQASAGQADLMDRQVDIDRIVREKRFSRRTRELLAAVGPIKAFGERNGLRATESYRTYVHLEREAVVWVVSACEPLSFRSKTWSFPITGSITYLGWFKKDEARAYATELAHEGWDVDLRPAPAYSTLGFFDDPVISTMFVEGDAALGELADTILHESLHATYFVPGQSTLNESVASFVGEHLARVFLTETRGPSSSELRAYDELEAYIDERGAKMSAAYKTLEALYASSAPPAEKLAKKRDVLTKLREATHARRELTNASLVQYETYGSGQKELEALFSACGASWPRFMRQLVAAKPTFQKARPHEDPARLLAPVVRAGCAP